MATARKKTARKSKPNQTAAMERYIEEIDRYATLLRDQQEEIKSLKKDLAVAKQVYDESRAAVANAKEVEHNTVELLLKFVTPGSIDIMPLFDTMDEADEEIHGKQSSEWRKQPIAALKLSAVAMRALIDNDIVLVGQLQDRMLKDGDGWYDEFEGISDGMSQAIEAKLNEYIYERTG